MHELSLCESVLAEIELESQRHVFDRVKGLTLEVGALAQVDLESFRFCFDSVMKDTLAEGAVLKLVNKEGSAWCRVCQQRVPVNEYFDPCPCCGILPLTDIQGQSIIIRSLEVV
jgi:hydrogenase nickel incorporation protein HypA/HybF